MKSVPEKDIAKQVIDGLPDGASFDEIMHALYVRAKFAKGEKEIRAGKGIPHAQARKRLAKWLK